MLPIAKLKQEAPPTPNKSESAMQDVVRGKAMLVAALPSSPTACPINSWSTMLYNAPTSIATMLGIANLSIRPDTGALPKSSDLFVAFILYNSISLLFGIF